MVASVYPKQGRDRQDCVSQLQPIHCPPQRIPLHENELILSHCANHPRHTKHGCPSTAGQSKIGDQVVCMVILWHGMAGCWCNSVQCRAEVRLRQWMQDWRSYVYQIISNWVLLIAKLKCEGRFESRRKGSKPVCYSDPMVNLVPVPPPILV
jgi:hypothetical protein